MIRSRLKSEDFEKALLHSDAFTPFPKHNEREKWEQIDTDAAAYYLAEGEKLLGTIWETLPAVRYMDFYINGNRSRYEVVYFRRRSNLFTLCTAECVEGRGRFMDDILNGIWAICEESSWVVPAHNNYPSATELPDVEAALNIDLFAAETGSLLAWVYYFLKDEIKKISPVMERRIIHETEKRIITPFMENNAYWWTGYIKERTVNNWNPWILSNILSAVLIFTRDPLRRLEAVRKTGDCIQHFLDSYHEDGGCDEGPSYFTVAGASLFDYLEELSDATNGAVSFWSEPLIKNIMLYIMRVYISDKYYVNFADAPARVSPDGDLLRRAGKYIEDTGLENFGCYLTSKSKSYVAGYGQIYRRFKTILTHDKSAARVSADLPKSIYFDGIQVMTAHEFANTSHSGLFTAIKGGHNEESHNHNDVGNFIIYSGGEPVIIDAGVEQYTKKTFSPQRYDIWTMQSGYHNLPTVNGVMQSPGKKYCAADVCCKSDAEVDYFSVDLTAAYSDAAKIISFFRKLVFDRRARAVKVSDSYKFSGAENFIAVNLLCYSKPLKEYGYFKIGGMKLYMSGTDFTYDIETVYLTDQNLRSAWGKDEIYRLIIKIDCAYEASYLLQFEG